MWKLRAPVIPDAWLPFDHRASPENSCRSADSRSSAACGSGPFFGSSECVLELLRRRHADQDGAHRRMRQRKPRGGFGQAGRKTLLDQRHQTPRAIDIGIVTHRRTNRLGRRTRNRVTLG
jgi:hypothetical protein